MISSRTVVCKKLFVESGAVPAFTIFKQPRQRVFPEKALLLNLVS